MCHGRTGKSGSRMFIVEWLRLHTVVFKRFRKPVRVRSQDRVKSTSLSLLDIKPCKKK